MNQDNTNRWRLTEYDLRGKWASSEAKERLLQQLNHKIAKEFSAAVSIAYNRGWDAKAANCSWHEGMVDKYELDAAYEKGKNDAGEEAYTTGGIKFNTSRLNLLGSGIFNNAIAKAKQEAIKKCIKAIKNAHDYRRKCQHKTNCVLTAMHVIDIVDILDSVLADNPN